MSDITDPNYGIAQRSEIVALRAEIARLQAELSEARKDGERLEWLSENLIGSFGPARMSDDEHPVHVWSFEAPVYEPEQGGIRKAIDSAMRKEVK